MNANPKFLAATAHVDDAAIKPLPNSRKVYVGNLRVPMREISQSDTPSMFGGEKNPPVYVYDCSGPYTDPAAKIDIRSGLPALREPWILRRNDTELLSGPSSAFGKERLADLAHRHLELADVDLARVGQRLDRCVVYVGGGSEKLGIGVHGVSYGGMTRIRF